MAGDLPRKQQLPTFWPASFVERFEVLGTLGSSRICRAFLARIRGTEEPLVADWYFSHREPGSAAPAVPPEAAALDSGHPGLVAPLWSGRCQDGSWLGVRAWVEEPLILPGRSTSPEDLARWLAQAGLALGHLHASGRLHGYLRPDSLLLDEKQNLCIALGPTFGLFQIAPPEAEPDPMWSSPERLQHRPLGPASDLYSLGTAFYKLAAGKPPFSTGGPELVRQQISQPVRSPLLHNPRLGLPIARILDRMLRKEPAERFSSANDLVESINRLMGTSFSTECALPSRPSLRPARWIAPAEASSLLEELLDRTRSGAVGMAVLEGESGVGKHELLHRLRMRFPDTAWILARARRRAEPFSPLVEALSALPSAPRPPSLAFREDSEPLDRPSVSVGAGRRRQELFRWAVEAIGRHLPLVLQIDSAELLDLPSLDLLCHLLTRAEAGGLLVLLSQHRGPDAAPVQRFVSRLGSVPVSWISVPRLSADQSADLVRSLLGETLPELEEGLFSLARGNPRSTELLLQFLLASGALRARDSRWTLGPEGFPLTSLSETAAALIGRLSQSESALLQAMELLDRPATAQELAALASIDQPLAPLLGKLETWRLVSIQDGALSLDLDEITLHLRDRLPADARRDLHRRAYEFLLPRGVSTEELAHHALGCGAHAAAARHLLQAADLRAEMYDVASAVRLYIAALGHIGPHAPEFSLRAHTHLGFLCLLQGDGEAAERSTRLALDLCQRPQQRLALLEQLARILIRSGAYDRALISLDQALPLASQDSAEHIRILAEKGWLCMRMGQAETAEQLIDRALTLAKDSGDPQLLEMRHAYLGRLAWSRGDMKHALVHFISAAAVAEQQGQLEEVVIQTINLATLHSNLGHGSAIVELCEKVLRLTEQTGDLYEESRALNLLGIHYSEQGLPARAITIYEKALEAAERLPNAIMMATVSINLGGLYKDQGDLERGLAALSRAQVLLAPCQNLGILAEARSAMAEVLLSFGNCDEAEALVRGALELRRSMGHVRGQVMDLYWLGRVLQERGQIDEARRLYEEGRELTEGKPGSSFEPHALLGIALAEVLMDAGLMDESRQVLATAELALDSHRLSWPSFLRWMARSRLESGPESIVAADRAIAVAEHLKYPELLALAHAAAGEASLRAGNRLPALRHFREAARGLQRLAAQIRDPALQRGYLQTRRRAQILEQAARLDADSDYWI